VDVEEEFIAFYNNDLRSLASRLERASTTDSRAGLFDHIAEKLAGWMNQHGVPHAITIDTLYNLKKYLAPLVTAH